jgi:CarD family transcriptional regulator
MYSVGDLVIYGCEGVCKVEDIGLPNIMSINKNRIYYTLSPVYMNEVVYAPVDGDIFMRLVLSRTEAMELIRKIPAIKECEFDNCDLNILKERYRNLMQSHDCMDLIQLIKTIFLKRQQVAQKGTKLSQVDDQYMKQAEELLHGEFAIALDIPKSDVQEFITNAIGRIERGEEI